MGFNFRPLCLLLSEFILLWQEQGEIVLENLYLTFSRYCAASFFPPSSSRCSSVGTQWEIKRMCASDTFYCSAYVFGPTLRRGSNAGASLHFGVHTVRCTPWWLRPFQARLYVFLSMLSLLTTVMIFPIICSSDDASVQPQINRNPLRMWFYLFLELTLNQQCSSYAPTDPILMVS